jgi:hypothetical protein
MVSASEPTASPTAAMEAADLDFDDDDASDASHPATAGTPTASDKKQHAVSFVGVTAASTTTTILSKHQADSVDVSATIGEPKPMTSSATAASGLEEAQPDPVQAARSSPEIQAETTAPKLSEVATPLPSSATVASTPESELQLDEPEEEESTDDQASATVSAAEEEPPAAEEAAAGDENAGGDGDLDKLAESFLPEEDNQQHHSQSVMATTSLGQPAAAVALPQEEESSSSSFSSEVVVGGKLDKAEGKVATTEDGGDADVDDLAASFLEPKDAF